MDKIVVVNLEQKTPAALDLKDAKVSDKQEAKEVSVTHV